MPNTHIQPSTISDLPSSAERSVTSPMRSALHDTLSNSLSVGSEHKAREDDLPTSVVDDDESFLTMDDAESILPEDELTGSREFAQEVHLTA
ncbi:hypothetical protein BGX29_004622, partial [Mortierella sp. GBA35]